MLEKQAEIETAIALAKQFPYKLMTAARVTIAFKGTDISRVDVRAVASRFPDPKELRELAKYLHLTIKKKLSAYGFPMLEAQKDGVRLRINCKSCPPGYKLQVERFPHSRVRRSCQLIEKPTAETD